MSRRDKQQTNVPAKFRPILSAYRALAPQAHSVIMLAALLYTLVTKFYHSVRYDVTGEYFVWILADLGVLITVEAILVAICYKWPTTWVFRSVTLTATLIGTWSVVNAAWIIKTGTQILPPEVIPLFKDPLNHFVIVGINLAKMPLAALALLGPSVVLLIFIFLVLLRPARPTYTRRALVSRLAVVLVLISITVPARGTLAARSRPSQIATESLHYNSQLKAIASIVLPDGSPISRKDIRLAHRQMPLDDQIKLPQKNSPPKYNVVMVVLESIQYAATSLADRDNHLTPYLESFAEQGAVFSNTRSTLTHTSKAIFSLQTGRYPGGSHDSVEAIPLDRPYASLATILRRQRGYRSAFFQSAKGSFESRPSLVSNLGFEAFWAREQINDPNRYLGYLGADDYIMIDPIADWIQSGDEPFFITVLCSAAHDPYEVPAWYEEPAAETPDRYRQIVRYTDSFLAALDHKLAELHLRDNTIVCIVGDHAEALGEHGQTGHERIGFEEALSIVWTLRSPAGIRPGTRIEAPVSSIDVAPTLLALLGFDIQAGQFHGLNALGPIPPDRKVYFAGWVPAGPAGYVVGDQKVIYDSSVNEATRYDLSLDPGELNPRVLSADQTERIADEVISWRKETLFTPNQLDRGRRSLFGVWQCRWTGRDPVTRYTLEGN